MFCTLLIQGVQVHWSSQRSWGNTIFILCHFSQFCRDSLELLALCCGTCLPLCWWRQNPFSTALSPWSLSLGELLACFSASPLWPSGMVWKLWPRYLENSCKSWSCKLGQCSLICIFKTFALCFPYCFVQGWQNFYSISVPCFWLPVCIPEVYVWWKLRRKLKIS